MIDFSLSSGLENIPKAAAGVPFFSSSPWLDCWYTHYARNTDLFLSVSRYSEGGHWVAPLMVRQQRIRGLPVRVLRFAGTGDLESEEVATEFPDIYSMGCTPDSNRPLGSILQATSGNWDVFRADCVMADSVVSRECERLGAWRNEAGWHYRLDLSGDFTDWLQSLKPSVRQRFKRTMRRSNAAGISMRWADKSDCDGGLDVLASLHFKRWQSKDREGVFASPRFLEFHRDLIRQSNGAARIAIFEQASRPLAAWYGFDVNGCRYYYQSGIEPGFSGLSLGTAMHLFLIQDAYSSGLESYDFMKGNKDSYKNQFCPDPDPLYHYLLPARTCRGHLMSIALTRSSWLKVSAAGS